MIAIVIAISAKVLLCALHVYFVVQHRKTSSAQDVYLHQSKHTYVPKNRLQVITISAKVLRVYLPTSKKNSSEQDVYLHQSVKHYVPKKITSSLPEAQAGVIRPELYGSFARHKHQSARTRYLQI